MSNAYWSEETFLRPSFITDAVWQKILTNFLGHIGNPLDDLPETLQDDIDRLEALGVTAPTALDALRFEIEQSGDFGSLAERGRLGSMGQGWSSLADIKLLISAEGISMEGLANATALSSLNSYQTTQYAVSLSLGKFVGQDGRFAGSEFARPLFTLEQRTSGDMTLSVISGGYQVTTAAGDVYNFDETGKLESFVSGNGQEIAVTYDMNDRISRYEDTFGNFIEFTYDGSGKIVSVEDADGHVSAYTYTSDKLTAVEDDAGDTDFTYDVDGNLLTAQRIGGSEITFTYDAEARLASQDIGGVSETYAYDNVY